MSASRSLIVDQTIIGVGDFITSTTPGYRSACAAEMCGYLVDLQITHKLFDDNEIATQINLHIASDCIRVIRKLEKYSKVVSIHTKLHPIIKEFPISSLRY